MSDKITVGEAIARTLEQYEVSAMYGIISIHNLPIADAVGQRGNIRFVPARGEAGAVTMADAHGRFSGLGVALTSTGAGAGNAVGAMIEALNANTPLLHITGQVEKAYLDADAGFIHETRDQLGFLRACSKRAYRVNSAEQAVAVIQRAILDAQTVPCGPVAVEIPIDIQSSLVSSAVLSQPVAPAPLPPARDDAVERLYQRLKQAKRPLLWLGGGALACGEAVRKLADAGVAVISSTHGRGILPDSHPRSLRAFHNSPSIEAILTQCDLTLVAGSRLRSNETRTWTLPLPRPLVQIDIDPAAANRNYLADEQINGDCGALLNALAARVSPGEKVNAEWDSEIVHAVQQAESALRQQSGEYAKLNDAIAAALPQDGLLVRDITVSGSVWGSRLFRAISPLCNIHSLAGAIGMGLPMAIGTAIANPQRKVVGLVGDGGLALGLGELATMAQEQANITLLIMNDGGYGVMRGIQDKYFAGRQYYNELHTPSFTLVAEAMGLKAWKVDSAAQFSGVLAEAINYPGPSVVEVDMNSIGPLTFAGPPQKTLY
ncbi:thiamine pyrophosphate-binding protein [Serratia proteamaculans]|uniref:thiamine pyrophosphate-binding protein n=1 Tax=Serratia proteamaculans TaxID=28151 RepID=UPI00124AAEBD|nr:thiamine pyrophosphate-binding protein [Serratia proteamaculans]KAB1493450.1 thiamine pyrophosphate-binding protein [Serratia proteamaculans]CAI0926126.1 Acetolactate synthase isozyme 1 large subunit [Serratia proteamaculans]CAI1015226.1 Acetolactate synthase isozyme 1 large subunit [Serratia proteamaculans]CAI1022823.1 Acetolactate synthase isozyme 1 large subunit [Serratia proteamaculans]CAI1182672.1 Acetolactate synthase isozyme 1 large subunit [Serratia proteamaculans]